jgi:malonyl-CoA decarboxylase
LEKNLHNLLTSWFSLAFLKLQELTWDSPISILEKIIKSERVHRYGSIDPEINLNDPWQDMKRRVAKSSSSVNDPRRLFCFVHPNMHTEPLIFVHVAFLDTIPHTMRQVLPKVDDTSKKPNTAIFYSISASQHGLRGIELGNFLIKRVVKEVQHNNSNITNFCTMSPLPGFAKWLMHRLQEDEKTLSDESLLTVSDRVKILHVAPAEYKNEFTTLKYILQTVVQQQQKPIPEELCDTMQRLAARYLYLEKKGGKVVDPVANFHIRNGARMYRVNVNADYSKMRLEESFGIMVNYQYVLDEIEDNNRNYLLYGIVKAEDQFLQVLEEQ